MWLTIYIRSLPNPRPVCKSTDTIICGGTRVVNDNRYWWNVLKSRTVWSVWSQFNFKRFAPRRRNSRKLIINFKVKHYNGYRIAFLRFCYFRQVVIMGG